MLRLESDFYACTGRHSGIVHAHSELICGWLLKLRLAKTGVASGADGETTDFSPKPFGPNQTVQIKGRGEHNTMHITFDPRAANWLIVVTYDFTEGRNVKPRIFAARSATLNRFARRFASERGKPAHPVRKTKGGKLRVEWWSLFYKGKGRVRKSWDTWEARRRRSKKVLANVYIWQNKKLVPCGDRFLIS